MKRALLPVSKYPQAAWSGFLTMAGAWALFLLSVVFFLEGKSVYGRFWILGALVGMWLLIIGYLMWTDKRPLRRDREHR